MRGLHCVVYVTVVEVIVAEMIIEVSWEVYHQARLLTLLDDDMKRLNAEVGEVGRGREFNDSPKVHVLAEALSYYYLMLVDGRGIGVGEDGGFW
jgi:hypothetical protein